MRWLLLLAVLLSAAALAIDTQPALPNAALQHRYERLTHEFRCLVCQDEDIADSDAGLAADLRSQVYQQLLQGKTDEQIKQYMVARYGDFVLFDPPFQPNTWLLWLAPAILLLAGLGVSVRIVLRRNRLVAKTGITHDSEIDW
ncbi:MAG: cytochrome c-type biogenesis protein CcmH [Gammaproteobacteria bacterium]|nr:cytochrome c-type biogenesis protein CcmH [Gammaproteobacteria bacterium]MDE1983866.1 cytochrome c-type biogenesis protein CcmH [Gammaproteobacteria bacterium]MDE2108022.1 cytochrome c-type biogenesis protein CcmH [Gammaproteobacteria bacterium]